MITDNALVIANGARPMMIFSTIPNNSLSMMKAATQLESLSDHLNVIPFIIEAEDEWYCVFAKEKWVVETIQWVCDTPAPEAHRNRQSGLLFRYTPNAVSNYEPEQPVRCFTPVQLDH